MASKRTNKNTQRERSTTESEGRFSYDGLDRVMHEKARLGILSSLAANSDGLLFNDLKKMCSLTDGNLSRHLGVLNDAGLVEIWKSTTGSRPQTMYRLTNEGRDRFAEYISELEKIVADASADARPKTLLRRKSEGFSPT